jgi:hypothetical protein
MQQQTLYIELVLCEFQRVPHRLDCYPVIGAQCPQDMRFYQVRKR